MTIEIVDFPIKNGDFQWLCNKLPEGSILFIQWEIQDPTDGGTLVPYFWAYFVGIFPYLGFILYSCGFIKWLHTSVSLQFHVMVYGRYRKHYYSVIVFANQRNHITFGGYHLVGYLFRHGDPQSSPWWTHIAWKCLADGLQVIRKPNENIHCQS